MSAAQAAQQNNRDRGGRYAESQLGDPGAGVLSGAVQAAEVKKLIGAWTAREYAARQIADEAVDERQTLHIAGVCADALAAHPTAVSIECWYTGGTYLQMGDILDADGKVLGQVPWTDSRINRAVGTDHPAWDAAFNREEPGMDIAEAIRIAQSRPKPRPLTPSPAELRAQVRVLDQVDAEEKLRWIRPGADGDITEGQLRHGVWTADGHLANVDPRDGHVRVTTRTGLEMWVPFTELVDASMNDDLAWGW